MPKRHRCPRVVLQRGLRISADRPRVAAAPGWPPRNPPASPADPHARRLIHAGAELARPPIVGAVAGASLDRRHHRPIRLAVRPRLFFARPVRVFELVPRLAGARVHPPKRRHRTHALRDETIGLGVIELEPEFGAKGEHARILALDADDLLQRVHDLDEIGLRRHHPVDVLVGARRFVDDFGVLSAFYAGRRRRVILDRELLLRLRA
jgi:hypothetical protein